jgi:tRNA-splicing ligase RtcB
MNSQETLSLIPTGEATAMLPVAGGKEKPVTVIGTEAIRKTFDAKCLQQVANTRMAPGVEEVVLNPDAHIGFGAPIGCVMASPTHIYPGPVGVDIKCSMSLLQLDLPADAIEDRKTRRALINAICQRTPTGAGKGQRHVPKARRVDKQEGWRVAVEGASAGVCAALGIPPHWGQRCEDSAHVGHDDTSEALALRLDQLIDSGRFPKFTEKVSQLGSYGGGNHFGECEIVRVADTPQARDVADVFGLRDGHVAFLSHCGSRGFGHNLAMGQFRTLQGKFKEWGIPFPAADKELCYAPLGTPEADAYIDDMSLGANFATVNHLLINALVLEAFQEVFPGAHGELVYFISHNIARKEIVRNQPMWVMRKGATRAFSVGPPRAQGDAFRGYRASDSLAGRSAARVSRHGREARRGLELLQCQSRRGADDGPQACDPHARSTRDQPVIRCQGHSDQLPELSQGRSAGGIQGLRRGAALGESRRPGVGSRPAASAVCDQGCIGCG